MMGKEPRLATSKTLPAVLSLQTSLMVYLLKITLVESPGTGNSIIYIRSLLILLLKGHFVKGRETKNTVFIIADINSGTLK